MHGKVYIFTNVNGQETAIVSSANFTEKGLSKSHEWGVDIDDQSFVAALDDSVANCCRFQELSRENVEALAKQIEEYIDKHSEQQTIEIPIDTSPYLKEKVKASSVISILDPQIAYLLKPVGVSEDSVKDHETFDHETRRVHFSKRRPRAAHKNSVLIWYAVGHGKIASIFQATAEPDRIPEDEITPGTRQARFPWYEDCINRTRNFGTNWMINDLHIGNLCKEFLQKYPDAAVTYVCKNALCMLNWGQDRVRLSFEFAKFIIEKVEHNIRR